VTRAGGNGDGGGTARNGDVLPPPQRRGGAACASGAVECGAALARAACEGEALRRAYTFFLDPALVDRARREVGERDVVRSIEAALAAALDYHMWVREVAAGERDVLS
jgi:hypothetical protein